MPHFHDEDTEGASPAHPLVCLWSLRMLILLDGHLLFLGKDSVRQTRLAARIGFRYPAETDIGVEYKRSEALLALRNVHAQAEKKVSTSPDILPASFQKNLDMLSSLAGLNDTERWILAFTVLLHTEETLDDAGDTIGVLSSNKLVSAVAAILQQPHKAVSQALRRDGKLARTGLVSIDQNNMTMLRGKLDLLSRAFADQAQIPDVHLIDLLRGMVNPSPQPKLTLADYPYLNKELSLLLPYLRQVIAQHRQGVNIFLHGRPGTGKSELVRAIACHLGVALYEISSDDDEGDPISGESRLRAYRSAQGFFTQHGTLLLFDEVEDVFNDRQQEHSIAQSHKAWMNRMLEDNRLPTFWVSNRIQGLDAAFLRRFDMIIELDAPPRTYRRELITRQAGLWLDDVAIGRLAESSDLSPATLMRTANVVATIAEQPDAMPPGQALETLIRSALKAQYQVPLPDVNRESAPPEYDPRFIRADADLAAIAERLKLSPSARLCLYGPPGTGKTAFGRWLAEQLERPLLVKRASDLLSMYVGGTEQNIACSFNEAEEENAVLLIDEVDSFLQNRQQAQRSWEITQVNEMLTQIERYRGILIASTNLMGDLDHAAMRRFDLKVRFDYLDARQSQELLLRYCNSLGLTEPSGHDLQSLGMLRTLTPGDFAAVFRQSRFNPLQRASELVSALEKECRHKVEAPMKMGFLS